MRTAIISARLTEHFHNELGCLTSEVSKSTWFGYDLPRGWCFGWMPPLRLNDSVKGQFIVIYSPELINEVTAHLDDDDFDSYLTVVEMYVDACIADPDADPETIRRLVDDTLFERAPFALTLWSETEARALDTGIVPVSS